MKKILLIRPFLRANFELSPPMGIISIGTFLNSNGYDVKIIDVWAGEDYKKEVESNIGDCIFIKAFANKMLDTGGYSDIEIFTATHNIAKIEIVYSVKR